MKIEDVFPILDVSEDGSVLTRNGDLTVGYELFLPTIYTISTPEYDGFLDTFKRGFNNLETGTMVHKQDWVYPEAVEVNTSASSSYLDDRQVKMYVERPAFVTRHFIYFTKCSGSIFGKTSFFSSFLGGRLINTKFEFSEEAIERFTQKVEQCISVITHGNNNNSISFRKLGYGELAPSVTKTFSQPERAYYLSPKGDAALGSLTVENDVIKIGSRYAKIFNFSSLEQFEENISNTTHHKKLSSSNSKFSVGYTNSLGLGLSIPHIYNQFYYKADVSRVRAEIERDIKFKESFLAFSRENEYSVEDSHLFLSDIIKDDFHPYFFSANVIYWEESLEELRKATNLVNSKISEMDVRPYEVTNAHELKVVYFNSIPCNAGDIGKDQMALMVDEVALCFLNLESSSDQVKSAYGMQLIDRTRNLAIVDVFNQGMKTPLIDNYNFFLIGPSGSGKSFFINLLIRNYVEKGDHMIIVDVGHSYEILCHYLNGRYLTYTEENPISFNPFHIPTHSTPSTEKLTFLQSLLILCWKGQEHSLETTETELNVILGALYNYYNYLNFELEHHNKIIPASFNSFYNYVNTEYREDCKLRGITKAMFDIDKFIITLTIYTEGYLYGELMNSPNTELANERFVVFELDSIAKNPQLYNIVSLVIMDLFSYKMFNQPTLRKHLIIEEAWKQISSPLFAGYIKYLFKTARKFQATIGVVTQELDDLIGNDIVKDSIISQSDIKMMLDQSKYEQRFDDVISLLGLSDKDKMLIQSINKDIPEGEYYKEICISWTNKYINVYGTKVTSIEYWMFTTKKTEKNLVKFMIWKFKQRGGSVNDALTVLGNLLEEYGTPDNVMKLLNNKFDYVKKIAQNPEITKTLNFKR